MDIVTAKKALDKIIDKARVHLYKPIQVAEILHRERVFKDIDTLRMETYRTASRKWRDHICIDFLGRTSTSSARYQDDVFNDNATPPQVLKRLSSENIKKNGIVEAYIYRKFMSRLSQMSAGLIYCQENFGESFLLSDFLDIFWREPGLKRSIDKIYEIVVYSLFSSLVDAAGIYINVGFDINKISILKDFDSFAVTAHPRLKTGFCHGSHGFSRIIHP